LHLSQRKSLGQVFLKRRDVVDKILAHAAVTNQTDVVEIGCGLGALTIPLAESARSLTIIESDSGFLAKTVGLIPDGFRGIIDAQHGDFTKVRFDAVKPSRFTVVANLPYQISTDFVQAVISSRGRIERAIIMVQAEFADRIVASPGSKIYGSLSIFAQFYLNVRNLFLVPRTAFSPVPKVDSRVIEIVPREKPLHDVDQEAFFTLVRSAFWGRRKTLARCMRDSPFMKNAPFKIKNPEDCEFFRNKPRVRGEELSIDDFVQLYKEIVEK